VIEGGVQLNSFAILLHGPIVFAPVAVDHPDRGNLVRRERIENHRALDFRQRLVQTSQRVEVCHAVGEVDIRVAGAQFQSAFEFPLGARPIPVVEGFDVTQ
jgi:hypothetical protein